MPAALSKIDVSGILFFFGILLSIGALDSAGILRSLATFLQMNVPSQQIIAAVIGVASAVIDNVPLVAATMGMYSLQTTPQVRNGDEGATTPRFRSPFETWLLTSILFTILCV